MKIKTILVFLLSVIFYKAYGSWIEVSNQFISIKVDSDTARFSLSTTGGEPDISFDDNKCLLYDKLPPTSFTTVLINDENFIFGGEDGSFIKRPYRDGEKIITEWRIRNINIVQEVSIITATASGRDDMMKVTYRILNKGKKDVNIGLRVLLDTLLGENDPKAYGLPDKNIIDRETTLSDDAIPSFWYCFDDYTNPIVRSQGVLRGLEVTKPTRIVFASWDRFYENKWDFPVNSTRDFRRRGTSKFDGAVALYYDPVKVEANQSVTISLMYGMYSAESSIGENLQISINIPEKVEKPPIPVDVRLANSFPYPLENLRLEILPPEGFGLIKGETNVKTFSQSISSRMMSFKWHLISGSVGGNFKVRVRATGIINGEQKMVEAETNFNINYVETPATQVTGEKPAIVEKGKEEIPYEKVGVKPETKKEISTREKKLMIEINKLDSLINEVTRKYQVLMGIYKGLFSKDSGLLDNLDSDIQNYENKMKEAEESLSDDTMYMRD